MHTGIIPSWARQFIGLKFGDKGRGPEEFDCWGLVRWIYQKQLQIALPDYLMYDSVTNDDEVESVIRMGREEGWEKFEKAKPLDVVLFNIYGRPLHVGVVINGDQFVHSPEDDFTRIEYYTARHWARRIEGFYRHEAVSSRS